MAQNCAEIVTSAFKLHGFLLRRDACQYLSSVLSEIPAEDRKPRLKRIIDAVQCQPLKSEVLDRSCLENAVESSNIVQQTAENVLTVIDVFTIPRFTFVADRKKFVSSDALHIPKPKLFDDVDAKANVFRDRYTIIHQRLMRHELFAHQNQQCPPDKKSYQLKPVEFLLGSSTKLTDLVVFGMLAQIQEGKLHLEDLSGAVELNLKNTVFHNGFFTEGTFVLAQGWHEDGIFHVEELGLPPIERAEQSRNIFGNINTFGGPWTSSLKCSPSLLEIEITNVDASFVIVSDIWLDNPKVLQDLRKLCTGYSQCPPIGFIFMGNFTSKHYGIEHVKTVQHCFTTLASLLGEFPTLTANSKIIILPGPTDPGMNLILPRPPLLTQVTKDLRDRFPSIIHATNPARVQYCTQEMVVLREDILTKMCRNSINATVGDDIKLLFAKTLLSQSHLCPLPLNISPVYWSYDNAMRLYPIPDVVITADKQKPFTVELCGCTVINPGSFSANNATFMVYLPASRQVEESRIPSEND